MLTSEVWVMGTDQTRTLAIACMLLAARDKANDGTFNGDPEYVKRFGYLNTKPDFKQLIEYGFILVLQDASKVLAECNTEKSREETEKSREETEKGRGEVENSASAFALPDWIDSDNWNLWIKTRKGKKMLPEQMQAQVEKLRKWKDAGLPYAQSLADSASNGWQGLFEPKTAWQKPTASPENFQDRDYGEGVTKL
jgi:hypothetical protein